MCIVVHGVSRASRMNMAYIPHHLVLKHLGDFSGEKSGEEP